MSDGDFSLTSHEVMRGIKVRDGRLRLRPSGLILLGTTSDGILAAVAAVAAVIAGGWWIVVAVLAVLAMSEAIQRTRIAVIATGECIFVRNRWWRRRQIPVAEVVAVREDTVAGLLHYPAYSGLGWWPNREWSVAVIHSSAGYSVQCDALISAPRDDEVDPTPAETKIAALNRWIAVHVPANPPTED